jgi:uncharacterized protein (TIGR00730 family)
VEKKMIKNIAVFCGSNTGKNPAYKEKAQALGAYLAKNKIGLVFGGGKVGLMGIIADAVLKNNGRVVGIMPEHLFQREVGHKGLTEFKIVKSMHERKALIEQESDAFIAMPGGMGTLDEIAEIFTWSQLNLHTKPFGFYNVDGYFDQLLGFFTQMVDEHFLSEKHFERIIVSDEPTDLLAKMKNYSHNDDSKWL